MLRYLAVFILSFPVLAAAQEETRLLRFPAIHGNQVVFTYAGDLYTVSSEGGTARKLTTDSGVELFARFSPDGKMIAFTGQYDGNTEVYVIPAEGGIPKRITITATLDRDDLGDRMGPNNIVMDWKSDNKSILFRSRMSEPNDFKGQLFLANLSGEVVEQLPLPRGGFGTFSPDNQKLAYNRIFREFRTWKRYRGGMADDVWIYDFKTKETINITDNPSQDIFPMWRGDKIYYISDRDENKRYNLFAYDVKTKETRKLTNFKDFDIKFPSAGNQSVIFENGGYLYTVDFATESLKKLTVKIQDDLDIQRNGIVDVSKNVTNFEISPDGNRALLGARGDVFTVPAKYGSTRNLTQTSGVHERNSKWSPDGKWIAYVSDATGEDEIYMVSQDGKGAAVQLTKNSENYKYELRWSPDSKKILWSDRMQRLRFVDVESKSIKEVASSPVWEITEFDWSPDSKWIAFGQQEQTSMSRVYLYSLASDQSTPVTDGWYSAGAPVFSADGKYLYFTSSRDFNPIYSETEWNHAYQDMSKVYLLTLSASTDSPFKPKSDEVAIAPAVKPEPKKDEPKKETKTVEVKVDLDGIMNRVLALPIQASNYRNIQSAGEKVYYIRQGSKDAKPVLLMFDLAGQKETQIAEVGGFEISADKSKILVGNNGNYYLAALPSGKTDFTEPLDLSKMKVNLDRRAEWKQIFDENWRQMRDFLFAPNMHGVDWKGVHDKYAQLLPYVNNRLDLTYILGEMVAELNIGHAYVGGGDVPKPNRVKTGQLGAELKRDGSGFYKIVKVLDGENWNKTLRSPLTEIGVNVKAGDFILAVNGKSTKDMTNIYESLIGTVGLQVNLTVNSKPDLAGSREVVVIPIADEQDLNYYAMVQTNIEKVNKATNGKVGYLHVPDMGPAGLNEFVKHFYPQLSKKALIIDVRGNGGGNVSPMLIERLRREIAMINVARNSIPVTNPEEMIWGPKVALCDEFSASDGDIFTYRFKHYKLGKVIGKRTWGGVVGIRGTLPFTDGGVLNRPEFSRYDVEGKEWIMEGYGVDPDIIVDNDPAKEFAGIDEQLNKAIEVILEDLKTQEKTIPPLPKYPVK